MSHEGLRHKSQYLSYDCKLLDYSVVRDDIVFVDLRVINYRFIPDASDFRYQIGNSVVAVDLRSVYLKVPVVRSIDQRATNHEVRQDHAIVQLNHASVFNREQRCFYRSVIRKFRVVNLRFCVLITREDDSSFLYSSNLVEG